MEALIPVNARSGSRVGVLVQFHIYLDDLLPSIFHPIFGGPSHNNAAYNNNAGYNGK